MSKFGNANALRDELTPTLLFVAFFSSAGAFTFGFDNAWWGGLLGHQYFDQIFGSPSTDSVTGTVTYAISASHQSAGTALGTAGIAIGCMAAGLISSLFGRKKSLYAVAIGSIVGVMIQITSGINGGRFWQLVVGKIIVCISIGIASVSVPLYQAECAPPAIRGALVNCYVWTQSLGGLIAYVIVNAQKDATGAKVYLIPIGIQLLAPAFILAFGWTLPESPHWLMERGRKEEARASLLHLRRGKANYDPAADLFLLEEAVAHQAVLAAGSSWGQCFRGSDGFRTFIVAGTQCLQQGQGVSFISNYLVVFFEQLGFSNAYLIIVIAYAYMSFLTMAGFWTQVFIWLAAFTQSWTSIPWTVSAELPSDALRDKTLAIGAFGGYVVGMLVGLVNPYMQDAQYGNLGGEVGYIYGGMSAIAVLFSWMWIPELKGRSLEEIDYMFAEKVSIRQMATYQFTVGEIGDAHLGNAEKAHKAAGNKIEHREFS